nr:uncharacterized protein LOC102151092 [Equus caballus]
MSPARRPRQPALPRSRSPSRARSVARRPSAPPAGLAARDSRLRPHSAPQLGGDPGLASVQRGAGRGRLCPGREAAAPCSPQPRRGVPLPFACPQLPATPSPHPTTPIKVHFGRESGLGLPLAPPGGSAHFAPRELSDPGGAGGSRAWPPLPPGAGWRSPRIELVGLLRRTFFSLRRPQHRARLGSGSLRAGKSPELTPSAPARSRRLRRGSGAGGGGGEESARTGRGRRAAGGQSPRWGEAGRSRAGGEGRATLADTPRGRARPPAENASSGPPGSGRRALRRGLAGSCLRPRSEAAETQLQTHLDRLPGPPGPKPQSPEGCRFRASRAGRRPPRSAGTGGSSPRGRAALGVRGEGRPGRLGPLWA